MSRRAQEMLAITDEMIDHRLLPTVPFDIPAETFAAACCASASRPMFRHDDGRGRARPGTCRPRPRLAASASRCAPRRCSPNATSSSCTEHEAFIHTLTSLNGRHQPHLKVLGLGAPRTTRTQEGLATFAEIITGAIDISRLRRIALRVVMVKQRTRRRRLHRGVPRIPRRRPERGRELPQRRARFPWRRRARRQLLHQGRRVPGRRDDRPHVHPQGAAGRTRRTAADAVRRAPDHGRT